MTATSNWTPEQILDAIEAHQWDYEASYQVPGISQMHTDTLILRRSEHSTSLFANKVMRSLFSGSEEDVEQGIEGVLNHYGEKAFSWWIGPWDRPQDLKKRLEARGFRLEDRYIGLAYFLKQPSEEELGAAKMRPFPAVYTRVDVATEADVRAHVEVSAEVWGLDEKSQAAGVRERLAYLDLPDRRGGYVVILDGEKPIANGGYRISADGRVLYLTGSAVLPEYRKQGIYHELLRFRFELARARGVEVATVQARVGTSEPILRALGFVEYGEYSMYVLSR